MKSSTSCSLAPPLSCSRTWLRRSTASGAFESARVWFWHTRQRSSLESCMTRFSSAGSSAEKTTHGKNSRRMNLATLAQRFDERPQLLVGDVARQRPDVLEADDDALVDDVGFRHAVDAVVDGDAAGDIGDRDVERIAMALEPRQRI